MRFLATSAPVRRDAARFVMTAAALAVALAVPVLGAAGPARAASTVTPIPLGEGATPTVSFTGAAHAPAPVRHGEPAPQNPFLAANGMGQAHDDGYSSDASPEVGPTGTNLQVTSTALGRSCALLLRNSRGRLLAGCGAQLRLLDADSLATIATLDVPSAWGYAYVDPADRLITPTSDGRLQPIATTTAAGADALALLPPITLGPQVGTTAVSAVLPDWQGRIWFLTATGVVGFVDPVTSYVSVVTLNEHISNGLAADDAGGVYVVSDDALYRLSGTSGAAGVVWRVPYDHGTVSKGLSGLGSGTTPTVFRADGRHYVAITDNADPQIHVLVFDAEAPLAPLCSVPVFTPGASSTDNSLVAMDGALFVTNNYGFSVPPVKGPNPNRTVATTAPGLSRVDVDTAAGSCALRWTNSTIRVPMATVQGSLASGLLYAYEQPGVGELQYTGATAAPGTEPDPWYFSALDATTGERVWSRLVGYGAAYENRFGNVEVADDGTAFVGVKGGLVSVRDGAAPPPASAGHTLSGASIQATFGDARGGLTEANNDRMDAVTWTDSSGVRMSNYVADTGRAATCGDANGVFGGAAPQGPVALAAITTGSTSAWTTVDPTRGTTAPVSPACHGMTTIPTSSSYQLSTDPALANQLTVSRTFTVTAAAASQLSAGLRAYIPQFTLAAYAQVLVPNAANTAVRTVDARSCAAGCAQTDWDTRWYAVDDGAGHGVFVAREANPLVTSSLVVSADLVHGANTSSVVLKPGTSGWPATVTEATYVCFYDNVTWPAAARTATSVPKGCGARPARPRNVAVKAGKQSATATFAAPNISVGLPVTGYVVTAVPASGGAAVTATGTASPITVKGLKAGQAYQVSVAAVDLLGAGLASTPIKVTPTS